MVLVEQVRSGAGSAPVSVKLKTLLAIAAAVQQSGLNVTAELVAQARAADATDLEIHDTVLIAAVFCMFNRYVDGLATIAPEDPALYAAGAQRLIKDGYLPPSGEPESPGLTTTVGSAALGRLGQPKQPAILGHKWTSPRKAGAIGSARSAAEADALRGHFALAPLSPSEVMVQPAAARTAATIVSRPETRWKESGLFGPTGIGSRYDNS